MSGEGFNPTGIRWAGQGYGMVEFGRDDQMVVMFYTRPVKHDVKSKEANRPIFEDMAYVKIFTPGERLNQVDRPVNDSDKQRWPRQWADYVHKRTQVPEGTPIDLLFPNHPAIAETMKGMGVYTVEQCSQLSAHAIDSIGMGGQEYVNKAKAFISSAEKGMGFSKLQADMETLKQQLRIAQRQVVDQKKQIDELLNRMLNPSMHSSTPPWQQGYDPQAERINATHPTAEAAAAKKRTIKRGAPTVVEDENLLSEIKD